MNSSEARISPIAVSTTPGLNLYLLFVFSWFVHLPVRLDFRWVILFDLLLVCILAVLALTRVSNDGPPAQAGKMLRLLSVYAIVMAPFAYWPGSAIKSGLPNFIKAAVFFYFTIAFVRTEADLKELEQCGEIVGLNGEAEHPGAHGARRRHGGARQAGSQNGCCQSTPGGIDAYRRSLSRGQVARRSERRVRPEHAGGDAMARKRRPVDSSLIGVVQRHIDDLRFDHHLALDGEAHRLQVLVDIAQLVGHRADDDHARLRADHDISTWPRSDQRAKRARDLAPEVALRNHRYAARVQGGGRYGAEAERAQCRRGRLPRCSRCRRESRRGHAALLRGRDRAGAHP